MLSVKAIETDQIPNYPLWFFAPFRFRMSSGQPGWVPLMIRFVYTVSVKGIAAIVILFVSSMAAADGPLSSVYKYNGNFIWVSLGMMSASTVKSLSKAKSFVVTVTFSQNAKVKKDSNGNSWFTFVLADFGTDSKWYQTRGSASVPLTNGVVKPGTYHLKIPVAGIPSNVLSSRTQTIDVGPSTSGLIGLTAFTVDSINGQ